MPEIRIRFAPEAILKDRRVVTDIRLEKGDFELGKLSYHGQALLEKLQDAGIEETTFQKALKTIPSKERLGIFTVIDQLTRQGFLHRSLYEGHCAIASQIIISRYFKPCQFEETVGYKLSRFAYCRAHSNGMLVESPRSYSQVILHEAAYASILIDLSQTFIVMAELSGPVKRDLFRLLGESGFLTPKGCGETTTEEEENDTLRQWEFHDHLFHHRSRAGRHDNPIGGKYRFEGEIEQQPAFKALMSDRTMPLPKPDLNALKKTDKSFTKILEDRRSLRKPSNTLLNLESLGEFLYRSARVQQVNENKELSWRPTPSGGALHELEIYVLANQCDSLESGLYYYAPRDHQLFLIGTDGRKRRQLITLANFAQGNPKDPPGILLFITARFQRNSWKYSSIAYALTLKNLGALFQTMYLVATAMDLAPCAIGTGDSEQFARLTGINPDEESTVGEFTLR